MSRNIAPNIAKDISARLTVAGQTGPPRSIRSGTMGAAQRSWRHRKRAISTAEAANAVSTAALVQPRPGASMKPQTRVSRAAQDSGAPSRSSGRASGSRDSGTTGVSARITATTGTFSQNAACHPCRSTSHPPTTGPNSAPTPATAAQMPIARRRSSGASSTWTTVESVAGMKNAAPRPIAQRAATSRPGVSPSAPATEASAQSASPAANARRLPYRSPRAPAARTQPPRASA